MRGGGADQGGQEHTYIIRPEFGVFALLKQFQFKVSNVFIHAMTAVAYDVQCEGPGLPDLDMSVHARPRVLHKLNTVPAQEEPQYFNPVLPGYLL
jgi:hypothetical protein